jgi:NAD+ synthase
MQELTDKLVNWIKEQVTTARRKGVVLGLSGGLDSSVVAVLCKRSFPNDTLAAIMPCYSSAVDIAHAQIVAKKFQITTDIIYLEETLDSILNALPERDYQRDTKKAAEANLKPRLRMLTLYFLATRLSYLVVGTGNRSELSVGYFSKYGDAGVDIMPLGNLVKSQVTDLARYLEIPEEIISKHPSAGLWNGQTDEGEMGITYKELDLYLTTGKAPDSIKNRIDAMITNSEHKRALPPIPPL